MGTRKAWAVWGQRCLFCRRLSLGCLLKGTTFVFPELTQWDLCTLFSFPIGQKSEVTINPFPVHKPEQGWLAAACGLWQIFSYGSRHTLVLFRLLVTCLEWLLQKPVEQPWHAAVGRSSVTTTLPTLCVSFVLMSVYVAFTSRHS